MALLRFYLRFRHRKRMLLLPAGPQRWYPPLEVYEKADENGQLTDVQPHILFRPQMGRKPSNGTGWAAFSLLALLLWGHIIRLWFGFAPHIIWVFKQFGQVQYPQKSRKVLG